MKAEAVVQLSKFDELYLIRQMPYEFLELS